MRVGSLILTLWWLFCGLVLGASAKYHFHNGQVWVGVLDLLVSAVTLTLFLKEARRIDKD